MTLRMNITAADIKTAQVRAVNRALEYVLGQSNEKVPLEYGDLQRSGRVDMDGSGEPAGQVTYDSPYAVIQHEELGYNHAPGREAKYLENAVIDNQPQISRVIQQGFTSGTFHVTTPQDKTYSAAVVPALAKMLHAQTIVQYNETGGYTENPNRPAVVFGVLPASPLTAVSIQCYNESRIVDEYNPEVYVQLRFRAGGSPLAVERLASKPFALLHWADNHPLEIWPGGVAILLSRHLSRTPIIQSGTNQYERADSYRLTVNPGEM